MQHRFTPEQARRLRAKRAGLKRAAFWRSLGFPNLALATAELQRKAAERRALGLVSPEWAKRLRRKGIFVGDPPAAQAKMSGQSAAVEQQPRRPRVIVDTSARGLTLSQLRSR